MDRSERVALADPQLEIVVKGRHAEVTERFRSHSREKLSKLERLDGKAYRLDVEISHESNPRQAGLCDRVELTLRSRGPVIRAEAAAQDMYAALDLATAKLEERLRRASDRRRGRQHAGSHPGDSLRTHPVIPDEPVAGQLNTPSADPVTASVNGGQAAAESSPADVDRAETVLLEAGPLVVREKAHDATPMTLDDALHRMELVGHDFYLFCCADTGLPSVVYRRRGYTYGVMRLQVSNAGASSS